MNNDFPITTKNTRMKADDSYIVFLYKISNMQLTLQMSLR